VPGLSEEAMARYLGEAHFLRGLAYSLLAETYGGVPIIKDVIGVKEQENSGGLLLKKLGIKLFLIMI
jgi:hypothetical protein